MNGKGKSKVSKQFLLILRQSGDVLFFLNVRRLRGYTATLPLFVKGHSHGQHSVLFSMRSAHLDGCADLAGLNGLPLTGAVELKGLGGKMPVLPEGLLAEIKLPKFTNFAWSPSKDCAAL